MRETVITEPRIEPAETEVRATGRRRLLLWAGLMAALLGSLAILLISRHHTLRDTRRIVRATALRHDLDPALVEAVVRAESSGNPRAVSRAQAYGLMQLKVATAGDMAGRPVSIDELFDPRMNVEMGWRYLKYLLARYRDNEKLALMAYNAGLGNVDRWRAAAGSNDADAILAEHAFGQTRAYVAKVLSYRRALLNP